MTLANGREYLAIPGPSVMPDRVLRAMHRGAPNIYEGALVDMVPGIVSDLKRVARTDGHAAIYIGNGHAAWEAAISNVFSRGDEVLVASTGRFAIGWAQMAEAMGVSVRMVDFGRRGPIDPERIEEELRADAAGKIKAVMCVQVDTSTSVRNDISAVGAAVRASGHPAILMVDSIACLACDVMEMDAWGVDVLVTGSQKGLMTPPGLGFVLFNDRANAARSTADCVTHYWDWRPRIAPDPFPLYFDGTAPTHHLYGLREALDMIFEEGLETVWARHRALAHAIWAAFDAWGVEFNIPDPAFRSHAVTTLRLGGTQGGELRRFTEAHTGVTLGLGIGMDTSDDRASSGYFRVGHMGHVNAQMVMGALGAIEIGLRGTGIAFRPGGLTAAAEVMAAEIAGMAG